MTIKYHEKLYDELVEIVEYVFMEIRDRGYSEGYEAGYKQGKFDANNGGLIRKREEIPKETPQQVVNDAQSLRDRIVEQAQADVSYLEESEAHSYRRIDYVVNKEKRTIVALVKDVYFGEEVAGRGIAKCAPGDCFNVHIGKAIALRRALGLEVPAEYLNAPQPTEVRVGDVIKLPVGYSYEVKRIYENGRADINRLCDGFRYSIESLVMAKIIDDSREGVTQ